MTITKTFQAHDREISCHCRRSAVRYKIERLIWLSVFEIERVLFIYYLFSGVFVKWIYFPSTIFFFHRIRKVTASGLHDDA
jgi:hypothetical protein